MSRYRYIDADALKTLLIETLEVIKKNPKMDNQEAHLIAGISMLGKMIDDAKTVDAVEVVRCKDCKYYIDLRCYYFRCIDDYRAKKDYCSFGRRTE